MTEFAGRTAVVTGGSSGMGRELVRQLAAEACNIAMCDVSPTGLAETQRLCEAAGLPQGLRVTTHIVDVADRTQVERFPDEVADRHQTDKIHLLFNNAGISGGGSIVTNRRDEWESQNVRSRPAHARERRYGQSRSGPLSLPTSPPLLLHLFWW
jgi:NAD(P)-dependent dehydrogenase (short-subunit alcohol dehydrogenase family)